MGPAPGHQARRFGPKCYPMITWGAAAWLMRRGPEACRVNTDPHGQGIPASRSPRESTVGSTHRAAHGGQPGHSSLLAGETPRRGRCEACGGGHLPVGKLPLRLVGWHPQLEGAVAIIQRGRRHGSSRRRTSRASRWWDEPLCQLAGITGGLE